MIKSFKDIDLTLDVEFLDAEYTIRSYCGQLHLNMYVQGNTMCTKFKTFDKAYIHHFHIERSTIMNVYVYCTLYVRGGHHNTYFVRSATIEWAAYDGPNQLWSTIGEHKITVDAYVGPEFEPAQMTITVVRTKMSAVMSEITCVLSDKQIAEVYHQYVKTYSLIKDGPQQ